MSLIENLAILIQRGGYVMVPLLGLSIVSLTLVIERACFWASVNGSASVRRLQQMNQMLRRGDRSKVAAMVRADKSPCAEVARGLMEKGGTDAVALEVVESQRPRLDRFMVTLSTIITAAPLLGILGTVIGIIRSFNLIGQQDTLTDPRAVSAGIAEALLTTALGLVIALFTLFPYTIYRAHAQRALGNLESVIASAQEGMAAPVAADAAESADTDAASEPGNRRRAERVAS